MKDYELTVVVAVDDHYIDKLWWSYQTWVKFKPEINSLPLVIIYDKTTLPMGVDASIPEMPDLQQLHPKMLAFQRMTYQLGRTAPITWGEWDMTGHADQREKMLTSLVFGPAMYVNTPWYLKLDADTFANAKLKWIEDRWFSPKDGKSPAFVASPWGYTKPGNLLDILDDWGDHVESLKGFPRLNMPHAPNSETVKSPRMASWVMFGNTEWLKEAIKACPENKLPVPSQDTFLYYMAHRRGDHYVRERMGNYGWKHASRMRSLVSACSELLAPNAVLPVHTLPMSMRMV